MCVESTRSSRQEMPLCATSFHAHPQLAVQTLRFKGFPLTVAPSRITMSLPLRYSCATHEASASASA